MGHIRITQLDGRLPTLSLMALARYHRDQGDVVHVKPSITREIDEPTYDRVYASAIFTTTAKKVAKFREQFPDAIIGGTGSGSTVTVEEVTGQAINGYDYSVVDPSFEASIGFSQRGCRLKCGFCVVPKKEGKNHSVSTIADIWRGEGHKKWIHLLDNDFFGQPEDQWRARIREIRDGGFKVCFSQGINVRMITPEAAEAIASIEYRNADFNRSRLYTAWDNLKDEAVFTKGIDILERAGVPPNHVMAYMLVGYDKRETWERIFYRFNNMVARGIKPFVMCFDPNRRDLKRFQRWSNQGLYRIVPNFEEYDAGYKSARAPDPRQMDMFGFDASE